MNARPVRTALATSALVLLLLLGSGASAAGRTSTAPPLPRFLWGAWIGDQFTGTRPPWDWNSVTHFEARNAGGRHISVLHWGIGTPWDHDFNYWQGAFNLVQNAGALSVVDLVTGTARLRRIANGAYDSSLRTWATEAAAWGQPFLLRFDFEMNGKWYPWGTRPQNRNTAADYVAAWRHVHRLFVAAGATNVLWVWCPNIDPYHEMTSLARLYPGNRYVDWTCLDGYNIGRPWTSFTKLYANSYQRIRRIAPTKPMIIGEVASTGHGGNKAHWIRSMFQALGTTGFRNIHGFLWWDVYGSHHVGHPGDWPIETSTASSTAFSRGIGRTLARLCRGFSGSAKARCLGKATT